MPYPQIPDSEQSPEGALNRFKPMWRMQDPMGDTDPRFEQFGQPPPDKQFEALIEGISGRGMQPRPNLY